MKISGKVFIVTGGASGLGEGTARMLAENGARVVVADMQDAKGAAVARDIGGLFVRCDVTQEADGVAAVAAAQKLGSLFGLVNCAGIAPAERTVGKNGAHTLASFSKAIAVNLIGSFNMIRLAAEDRQRVAVAEVEPEQRDLRRFVAHDLAEVTVDGVNPGVAGVVLLDDLTLPVPVAVEGPAPLGDDGHVRGVGEPAGAEDGLEGERGHEGVLARLDVQFL